MKGILMKKTHLISYDLNNPGKNYSPLYDAIKNIGTWWHCLDSTWLVSTTMAATQVRDKLKPFLDQNDELLVAELSGEAAWIGFNYECSNWLKNQLESKNYAY